MGWFDDLKAAVKDIFDGPDETPAAKKTTSKAAAPAKTAASPSNMWVGVGNSYSDQQSRSDNGAREDAERKRRAAEEQAGKQSILESQQAKLAKTQEPAAPEAAVATEAPKLEAKTATPAKQQPKAPVTPLAIQFKEADQQVPSEDERRKNDAMLRGLTPKVEDETDEEKRLRLGTTNSLVTRDKRWFGRDAERAAQGTVNSQVEGDSVRHLPGADSTANSLVTRDKRWFGRDAERAAQGTVNGQVEGDREVNTPGANRTVNSSGVDRNGPSPLAAALDDAKKNGGAGFAKGAPPEDGRPDSRIVVGRGGSGLAGVQEPARLGAAETNMDKIRKELGLKAKGKATLLMPEELSQLTATASLGKQLRETHTPDASGNLLGMTSQEFAVFERAKKAEEALTTNEELKDRLATKYKVQPEDIRPSTPQEEKLNKIALEKETKLNRTPVDQVTADMLLTSEEQAAARVARTQALLGFEPGTGTAPAAGEKGSKPSAAVVEVSDLEKLQKQVSSQAKQLDEVLAQSKQLTDQLAASGVGAAPTGGAIAPTAGTSTPPPPDIPQDVLEPMSAAFQAVITAPNPEIASYHMKAFTSQYPQWQSRFVQELQASVNAPKDLDAILKGAQ